MIFSLLISAAILAVFAALFLIFVLDLLILGHDLPTSKKAAGLLIKIIRQYRPDAKNFYDLGCAHGGLSLFIKRTLPGLEVYAIDNSAVRIFFARAKSMILREKINFEKQDIFNVNLSQADIVYAYLWHDLMLFLEEKLKKELKREAIVVTNSSSFSKWKAVDRIIVDLKLPKALNSETLFVYIKE